MAKIKLMINLTKEQKDYVKKKAIKLDISMSVFIGNLIDYEIFMEKGDLENAKNVKRKNI